MNLKQKAEWTELLRVSFHVFILLLVPAIIAWVAHLPFIFPSLGPSAFALATHPGKNSAGRVVGGHLLGVLGGWAAYYSIGAGTSLTLLPGSTPGEVLRLGISGAVSVTLTSIGMLLTGARHAPACATTLIVALGLLPKISDGGVMIASVIAMFGAHKLLPAAGKQDQK